MKLSDTTLAELGLHLNTFVSVRELILYNNSIGDQGAQALGQHLAKVISVQSLHLNDNIIGDEGAKALGPHLANLTKLRGLYLHSNRIGDEGAEALALFSARARSWQQQSKRHCKSQHPNDALQRPRLASLTPACA